MRIVLIFLAFILGFQLQADPPNRHIFSEARSISAKEGRLHVVYFSATWCAPCQVMKEYTWPSENVTKYIQENCVLTFMDVDDAEGHDFSAKYGVGNIPTILVFNSKGKNVGRIENSLPAETLIEFLDRHNTPVNREILLADGRAYANPNVRTTNTIATTTTTFTADTRPPPIATNAPAAITYPGQTGEAVEGAAYPGTMPAITYGQPNAAVQTTGQAVQEFLATSERPAQPLVESGTDNSASLYHAAQPMKYSANPASYATGSATGAGGSMSVGQRFSVQVGAFGNLEYAVQAQKKYIRQYGLDAIVKMPMNGEGMYRVLIGNFSDRESADALDDSLQETGFAEAFVRTH